MGSFGPKFSFGGNPNSTKKIKIKEENVDDSNITPGPGHYDNSKDIVCYKSSSYIFPKEKKDFNPLLKGKEVRPEPATYNIGDPDFKTKNVIFSKDKRFKDNKEKENHKFYNIPYSLFDFPTFVPVTGFDTKYRYI